MDIEITTTLCFIKRGDNILMLNRENPFWMGSWNGVGGRIEDGETPEMCVLREVYEETGIRLISVRYGGVVTWNATGELGGMHVFTAEVPEDFKYETPKGTPEGILDWKPMYWLFDEENTGVIKNIKRFLPKMLAAQKPLKFHCVYEGYSLKEFVDEN